MNSGWLDGVRVFKHKDETRLYWTSEGASLVA